MNIINIINKKRLKETLTDEEIKYVIEGFLSGEIKDYQMSSLLMAILINDMTKEEIFSLTKYMAESGDTLDLTSLGTNVVDKHSTGGVGDKTTIIIAPIVAACGAKVAKMSGRGLGHTGGTIDKLESIPGFTVNLKEDEFISQVAKIGLAITSQTENVAIADKKIYQFIDFLPRNREYYDKSFLIKFLDDASWECDNDDINGRRKIFQTIMSYLHRPLTDIEKQYIQEEWSDCI